MIPIVNRSQKNSAYLNTVLMQLLPRICAFPQCDRAFQTVAFDTSYNVYDGSLFKKAHYLFQSSKECHCCSSSRNDDVVESRCTFITDRKNHQLHFGSHQKDNKLGFPRQLLYVPIPLRRCVSRKSDRSGRLYCWKSLFTLFFDVSRLKQ